MKILVADEDPTSLANGGDRGVRDAQPGSREETKMLSKIAQVLVKAGFLSEDEAHGCQQRMNKGETFLDVLLRERVVDEEALAQELARYADLPFLRLPTILIDAGVKEYITEGFAREHTCAGIKILDDELTVAVFDPLDVVVKDTLEFGNRIRVKRVVSPKSQILDAIQRIYNLRDAMNDFVKNIRAPRDLQILESEASAPPAGTLDLAQFELSPVVKIVNLLIAEAVRMGASDVHIEPQLNLVQVRHRIDGVLVETMVLPKWMHPALVGRVKIISEMDIAQRRVPQDGRIRATLGNRDLDLRVSCLPTHLGEKIVIRLLGLNQAVPTLERLSLLRDQKALLESVISKPQGTVFATGPTGSGKTTTLYACLNAILSPKVNVVTLENPVEYQVPGVNQVQINEKAGMTFAAALRSILRQDPNVILVGEIRDRETAEIALQAAATGHLVFSTLHTNSAAASVARLLDLGIEPFQLVSSVMLIIAQRLLRLICPDCREGYKPREEDLEKLGLSHENLSYFRGRGCSSCKQTGYQGRVAVFEMLPIQGKVRALILEKASEERVQETIMRMGIRSLAEEAIHKIRQGVTTPEEVLRVVKIDDSMTHRCPKCAKPVLQDFLTCPFCEEMLRRVCPSCGQDLRFDWSSCPYCHAGGQVPALPVANPVQPVVRVETGKVSAEPASEPGLPGIDKVKVLIAEDNDVTCQLVGRFVKKLKYATQVFTARDGEEALRMVEAERPHLLILDVMMPKMDGFTVCSKLRENLTTAFIPVLMMTASPETEARSKAFAVGTDDFVPKPIKPMEFKEKLERLLDRTYGI